MPGPELSRSRGPGTPFLLHRNPGDRPCGGRSEERFRKIAVEFMRHKIDPFEACSSVTSSTSTVWYNHLLHELHPEGGPGPISQPLPTRPSPPPAPGFHSSTVSVDLPVPTYPLNRITQHEASVSGFSPSSVFLRFTSLLRCAPFCGRMLSSGRAGPPGLIPSSVEGHELCPPALLWPRLHRCASKSLFRFFQADACSGLAGSRRDSWPRRGRCYGLLAEVLPREWAGAAASPSGRFSPAFRSVWGGGG